MEINKTNSVYGINDKTDAKITKSNVQTTPIKADSLQGDSVTFKTEKAVSNSPFGDVVKAVRKNNFNYNDFNKDGKIPLNEYIGDGSNPADPKNEARVKAFNEIDINHNNEISVDEAMLSKFFYEVDGEKGFEPILKIYFDYNDQNQDNKISKEEFLQTNGVVDEKDKQAFYIMFRLADKNNNGVLSKEEFKKHLYATIASGLDIDRPLWH